jgi:protein-tyrosine-phosphatase
MKKILFVCTGNTCRSPMAMAVCNKALKEKGIENVMVDSAGIASDGGHISANSGKALEKMGIYFTNYRSKQIDTNLISEADLIVTMTSGHKQVLTNAGVPNEKVMVLGGGIPDPFGGDLSVYEDCLKQITLGINELFEKGVIGDIQS